MKLRCSENSIRLRLRKSEVEKLKEVPVLKENVQVGLDVFSYGIGKTAAAIIHATFDDGCILLHIPEEEMMQWVNDAEQVGMSAEQLLKNGQYLSILIEKDFPCINRPEEDKADTFQQLAAKEGDVC